MQQFKQAGVEPPMDKIADKVLGDYKSQMSRFMENMKPEDRSTFLGENNIKSISSEYAKSINKNTYVQGNIPVEARQKEEAKGFTQSDMSAYLDKFR